jgi:hypothetical protein
MSVGPGDIDLPALERLAQRIENRPLNSGSSSRNSTPIWARLISPGFTFSPPLVSAAMLAEWWVRGTASRDNNRSHQGDHQKTSTPALRQQVPRLLLR